MNRIYNGCPDSDLKEKWEEEEKRFSHLIKIEPNASITYFPLEQMYLAFIDHSCIGKFQPSRIAAIEAAIKIIKE